MSKTGPEPHPYRVNLAVEDLADLRDRLARTRWPDEPPDAEAAAWAYGTDLRYLRELVAYWQSGFDWRVQESLLNQFSQHLVRLGGIDLHFIHQPGVGPNPLPLLI